jgi:hypothetical protein
MDLAYAAGRAAGTMTGVLSAANEQVLDHAFVLCFVCCFVFGFVLWFVLGGVGLVDVVHWRPGVAPASGREGVAIAPLFSPSWSWTRFVSCLVSQAVQMFIDEKVHYLDIMKLNEACCEAHKVGWGLWPCGVM